MLPEPIAVTLKVTTLLEKLGVPYLIGGSLASTIHGVVRTTQDSDLIAELREEHIPALVKDLQEEFYMDREMMAEAIRRKSSFNIIHRDTMFKVDVFIPRQTAFYRSRLSRAQRQLLATEPETTANVSSAEDTLLAKLEWYRRGGEVSERQWRDVLGILKVQGESLDLNYLEIWAKELSVNDLLIRALADAEIKWSSNR